MGLGDRQGLRLPTGNTHTTVGKAEPSLWTYQESSHFLRLFGENEFTPTPFLG